MPKKVYVGVETQVPVYGPETTVQVNESNVSTYFDVQNGSPYYFPCSGGVWKSNNKGVHSTTATTTLVAKRDFSSVSFDYSYSGESNYDRFTLIVAGAKVADGLSGSTTTKSYSGSLKAGDKIELSFRKDSSGNSYDDCATLSKLALKAKEVVGQETKRVAKKVKKVYLGIETDVPVYNPEKDVSVTETNIAEYFDVSNGSYYFVGSDGVWTSNNKGKTITTASTQFVALRDFRSVRFTYSYSCSSTSDYFSLQIGRHSIESFARGPTTVKTWSGSIKVGESIQLTYFKDRSSAPPYYDDCAALWNLSITTKAVDGYQKKAVARRVKKGYVGVGGVARPFLAPGRLSYYGEAPTISLWRESLAATTVGGYALFGGGYNRTERCAVVDAYDTALVRSTPTALSFSRYHLAATTVGGYALFGGGCSNGLDDSTAAVDAYDTALVRSTPTALSLSRYHLAATTVGGYALFGGGAENSKTKRSSRVDAYNAALVRSRPTELSTWWSKLSATTVGGYAIFAAGERGGGTSSAVEVYNTALVRSSASPLRDVYISAAATTVGGYALFGGGSTARSGVNAYDASLVRSILTPLSLGRASLAATTVGDYALFGGGDYSNEVVYRPCTTVVDAYDTALVRSTPTGLSYERASLAATTVGDYALFCGGSDTNGSPWNAAEAYVVD